VIAIDVGGTSMKGALVGADGALFATGAKPTPQPGGGDADAGGVVLEAILAYAEELAEDAGAATGRAPVAAGLVVPGLLDEARGVAEYAANLGWRQVPLREAASRRLGLPVRIGHDVRTAALAESRFGTAAGHGDFLYLSIGTGIAGALVVAGRPYAGVSARGGELGHAPVGAALPGTEPETCRCGQVGCLETYASAAAVLRRYQARGGDPALPTPAVVDRAVDGSDPLAEAVWGEAVSALAVALAWYTMVLDPALVIIGGGLAEAAEALFDPLREALTGRLTWREPPRVEAGSLGQSAGCLGAAVLAWRAVGRELTTIAP
jgi:glucokinase